MAVTVGLALYVPCAERGVLAVCRKQNKKKKSWKMIKQLFVIKKIANPV